jgi:nickel-dependent lactate racemase
MRVGLASDRQHWDLEIDESALVATHRAEVGPALADPAAAVRAALESPFDYPALRRALTPDDHIAVVIDEDVPHLPEMLVPILEHICQAGVAAAAITLVCRPPSTGQAWVEELPDEYQDVRVEVHQPGDRRQLAYLATTKRGRRVYLNRSVVDADQVVVLSRRRYDPLLGYAGAEGTLYPGLGDEATLDEVSEKLDAEAPGGTPWPLRAAAAEVAWLLGAPFLVQVIEGAGSDIAHVIGGALESSRRGQHLLDERWRIEVETAPDVVIATLSGAAERHTFEDFARAFLCGARVVRPGGSVVLLADAAPSAGPSFELFRRLEDPGAALKALESEPPADFVAGFMWISAALRAKLYLLSGLPGEVAEELFVTPLEQARQVEKLLGRGSCLYLPDAHKALAVLKNS